LTTFLLEVFFVEGVIRDVDERKGWGFLVSGVEGLIPGKGSNEGEKTNLALVLVDSEIFVPRPLQALLDLEQILIKVFGAQESCRLESFL
jgi:hypothetical protein